MSTSNTPLVPGAAPLLRTGRRTPSIRAGMSARTRRLPWTGEAGDIGYSASLAVDGSGRLHVSYADFTNGDLKYATCAADCTSPSSWQTTALDHTGNLGGEDYTSLAVDASGGVHVSYFDDTNADLKYIR